MKIQIAYASSEQQTLLDLDVNDGVSIQMAIEQSGQLKQYTELDLSNMVVGIFSRRKRLETLLQEGDRIEIYRPLLCDPMDARRVRAKRQAKAIAKTKTS